MRHRVGSDRRDSHDLLETELPMDRRNRMYRNESDERISASRLTYFEIYNEFLIAIRSRESRLLMGSNGILDCATKGMLRSRQRKSLDYREIFFKRLSRARIDIRYRPVFLAFLLFMLISFSMHERGAALRINRQIVSSRTMRERALCEPALFALLRSRSIFLVNHFVTRFSALSFETIARNNNAGNPRRHSRP